MQPKRKTLTCRSRRKPAPSAPILSASDQRKIVRRERALEWLTDAQPTLFTLDLPRPIKIRIDRDIMPLRPPWVSSRDLRRALKWWCAQPAYHRAVAAPESHRYDLAGESVGPVSVEHRERARGCLNSVIGTGE